MPLTVSAEELSLRQDRMASFIAAWEQSPRRRDVGEVMAERKGLSPPAVELLRQFLSEDVEAPAFRDGIDAWSRGKPVFGFGGPAGSMFLNQLVNDGGDSGTETYLRRLLPPPVDIGEASARVDDLAAFVQELRQSGSAAAVGRCPFFLTWFWSLQEPQWRPMWPSCDSALQKLAWTTPWPETQGQRLEEYDQVLRSLSEDVLLSEEILTWLGSNDLPVGLDPTLPRRCERANYLPSALPAEGTDAGGVLRYDENLQNVRIGVAEMSRIGRRLAPLVAEEIGHPVTTTVPPEYWDTRTRYIRGDFWLSWRPQVSQPVPGLRIHCGREGVHFVLNPEVNRNPKGFSVRALELVSAAMPSEWSTYKWGPGDDRDRLLPRLPDDSSANFHAGYEVEVDKVSSLALMEDAVRRFARQARPVIQLFMDDSEPPRGVPPPEGEDLAQLAGQFVAETGYPREADIDQRRAREEFASFLEQARLSSLTKEVMRRIYSTRYGSPGPQSILSSTIRDADDTEWERFLKSLDILLWGEQPVEQRINRVLDESDLGFRGLKDSVIMKLLAITHPDRFLPVFPFSGPHGKAAMLQRMGQPAPSLQLSSGELHVQANDALRQLVEPLFPADPFGQMVFLYWVLERSPENDVAEDDAEDTSEERLSDAAVRLYLDRSFLESIVDLLKDKGQVIFYGPPGTGKTFVAQVLAEALVPDPDRRLLVQFHPSTTYEDFFEGYRPEPTEGGGLTYRLVPGPLRNLADAAEQDPEQLHLLIIDEINRANLPKVLGELLFLLEYRGEAARVLYRPEVEFRLPANLWIIGTMNTADRSIALVDAALRRRFHFVPFVPDLAGRSPISQVLRRWVEANDELETLPDIVDKVNNQIRAALGGDHLLLGPSYFMKRGIDEGALRRIWEFQIEPLIEDLFFGEPERVNAFRFERVWVELGKPAVEAAVESLSSTKTDDADRSPA